jgi:D-alanyl-D-alanine carboxypeptidase/D-alanyl-D-alanine-endopeptidase (penicillin-binding protein 4)
VIRPVARAGAVLLAGWLLAASATAYARPAGAPLEAQLGKALRARGIATSRTGAIALVPRTGAVVFQRNAAKPFRPASTEKLTVSLAALDRLGPRFTFETLVLGRGERSGTVWHGDVVLEGSGDPSLHADDLARLARQVRAAGIRRVTGRVLGDESYFDARRTGPGWKPSFYKLECPPLSALVVDRAWLDGRTADEPALAAAIAFRRALGKAGVKVIGKARKGEAGDGAAELARVSSASLASLVRWMNTESDNFVAEMLLKALGAAEAGQGTTAAGAGVVRSELGERGVPLAGVRIADGSGLSRDDRLTARALAALLGSARQDARISRAFVDSLAVAGVSGTLEDRMRKGPARGRVRAKTGTTDSASALAGYAGARYVFAVLMNGSPVPFWTARRAQDRFATVLAASL